MHQASLVFRSAKPRRCRPYHSSHAIAQPGIHTLPQLRRLEAQIDEARQRIVAF